MGDAARAESVAAHGPQVDSAMLVQPLAALVSIQSRLTCRVRKRSERGRRPPAGPWRSDPTLAEARAFYGVNADLNCTLSPTEIAHSGVASPGVKAQASCRLGRRARGGGDLAGVVARRVARARCSRIR